jgi:cob(I)alamin adenosyltransferase
MANRLSKIVTRTGDDGSTGLSSGERTAKDSRRICAIGDVDELNSTLGLLLAEALPQDMREALSGIQHDLFDLGGELSLPGHTLVGEAHLARLDHLIGQFNAHLPPLREFVLPGGSRAAAIAHVARTVCRRAERALVALGHEEKMPQLPLQYLNRLSDLLFVMARVCNRATGHGDVLWEQRRY